MPDGIRIDAAVPASYQSAGLCVLPARLPAKRPAIGAWKDYQARLPTAAEVSSWFANAHHACCLICGAVSGNLELIDFDCAGESFNAWSQLVMAEAPGLLDRLVVESSPSGGWHVVYRSAEPVCGSVKLASRREDLDGPAEVQRFGKGYKPRKDHDGRWHIILTMIETRGEGGLFLCAPSPGYQLMQGAFTALPILTPAERDVLLRCAWALNQLLPEAQDPQPASGVGLRPGDDFNARHEMPALLTHHGWSLFRDGENQHWSRPGKSTGTSATLKGGVFYVFSSNADPFEPNRAYSPFAVYALLEHAGDYAAAAKELRRLGYGDQTPAQPAEPEPEAPVDDPGPVPVELLRIPGFIGQVMNYCLATAPYPEPTLAFCGAATLLATLIGRKVRDAGDNRSNLYLLGLANSGAGKDHPRKVNQRILHAVGLASQMGDSFASAEGIEDRLLVSPTMLFQTDEIDALLISIKESKDGRAERMMQTLLKFYSASNALYHLRVKAGQEPALIDQPCLSIFGTAIPRHFYESLSAKMLSNGFFARMLVLEAGRRGTGQEAGTVDVPESILAVARAWAAFAPVAGANLGLVHPAPVVVPATPAAADLLRQIRAEADRHYAEREATDDQMGMALWARAAEKVRRLALIYACSQRQDRPEIGEPGVSWAWHLVAHQTRRMLAMATVHVYESEFDARQKRALRAIQDAGGRLRQEQFSKALRTLPARERDEVIANLIQTGQIVVELEESGGRPRTVYRLTALAGKSPEGR
jgi:hypothetical protein